jgi:transposase
MKTTLEIEAEVVRLHYAEHWPVGTIATQLEVHPDVVRRVLGLGQPRAPSQMRPRIVDPYRAFIDDTLSRYPKLLATRLYDMVRERGFRGSVRTLREHVALVRPRPKREAYLVTETLPGEQAQVDWAYVGKVTVPGGERGLWVFVMVLAHSRAMWGEFVIDLTVHSLCRSLVRGAAALGGAPREHRRRRWDDRHLRGGSRSHLTRPRARSRSPAGISVRLSRGSPRWLPRLHAADRSGSRACSKKRSSRRSARPAQRSDSTAPSSGTSSRSRVTSPHGGRTQLSKAGCGSSRSIQSRSTPTSRR